jgi:hypothetical protein
MDINMIIQELEKGLSVISALVGGLTTEEARIKPDADNWSALEVICHLVDEEREDFRMHITQTLSDPQPQWHAIDPEGWVSDRHYQTKSWEDQVSEFKAERRKTLRWLSSQKSKDWIIQIEAPFGRISAGDLLAAWVMHDNLHIRQLIELRHTLIQMKSAPFITRYAGEW